MQADAGSLTAGGQRKVRPKSPGRQKKRESTTTAEAPVWAAPAVVMLLFAGDVVVQRNRVPAELDVGRRSRSMPPLTVAYQSGMAGRSLKSWIPGRPGTSCWRRRGRSRQGPRRAACRTPGSSSRRRSSRRRCRRAVRGSCTEPGSRPAIRCGTPVWMLRSVIFVRASANVGYGSPEASIPRTFLMLFDTASTQAWWPPSAL